MADSKQTVLELKGLVLAIVAGLLVVGLAFGVAAIMRHAMPPPAPSSATVSTPTAAASATYTPQMISDGSKYYGQACASCHGTSGMGLDGPNLHNLRLSDDRIARTIKNGKGPMPAFGKQFSDAQIQEIVGYLRAMK